MEIDKVVVGDLGTNCYVLTIGSDVILIDPGDEYSKILPYLENKNIIAILITHWHDDHVSALDCFDSDKVYSYFNLKFGRNEFGPFVFDVIYTPGHTRDSVTYYFENDGFMFTGDFLFKGTIGRCDLPTGDEGMMKKSLRKISKYPDNVLIYPGHGFSTTLLNEKKNNVYFSLS